MKSTKSNVSSTQAYKTAEPVRKFLQEILKDRIKTKSERETIAKKLGKSVGAVNSLLYEGKGGFDLMIAAFLTIHNLKEASLKSFFLDFKEFLQSRTGHPHSPSREFNALEISDEEKMHWISVIRVLSDLNYSLKQRK